MTIVTIIDNYTDLSQLHIIKVLMHVVHLKRPILKWINQWCLCSPLPQYQHDGLLLHPGLGHDASLSAHLYPSVDVHWHHQNPVRQHWWAVAKTSKHVKTGWSEGKTSRANVWCVFALSDHPCGPSCSNYFGNICETEVAWKSQKDPQGRFLWSPFLYLLHFFCKSVNLNVYCTQIGSIAGFGLIIILAVVGGVLYQSSWTIAPSLWIIGTIYPFIGFGLGFALARITGQPWYR